MIGEYYDYLLATAADGNMCLQLNGKRIVSRDLQTLVHMVTNGGCSEHIIKKFSNLYEKSKGGNGTEDFSKEVLAIMNNDWVDSAKYGIDFAYTEMTNYINYLLA